MARLTAADFGWTGIDLRFKHGAPARLLGIDLYHDFRWLDYFTDHRAQFPNGLHLARFMVRNCPSTLTPALLLTNRDDIDEGPSVVSDHLVWIVNLPKYRVLEPDAALTHIGRIVSSDIGRLIELVRASPEELHAFLDLHLTPDVLEAWAAGGPERIEILKQAIGKTDGAGRSPDSADLLEALRALDRLDADVVAAFAALVGTGLDTDALLSLIKAVTDHEPGRRLTTQVLGQRIADRIADIRRDIASYEALLDDPTKDEPNLQTFLEQHPWLLGLEYVHVRPQKLIPRGTLDFILERSDGTHDLLELKTAQDRIITAPPAKDGVPPPAHKFALSEGLAQALAQVHVYGGTLTGDSDMLEKRYGLRNTRNPKTIIVIGCAEPLEPHCSQVLRDLNLSLHRIEIIPYDVLGERAKIVLRNVEKFLSTP
jgi:hypothetical protein